jgi:hypothetical protein
VLLVQHTTQQPEEVIIIITGKEAKCGAWGFPSVILYLQKKHSPHSHGDIPSFCCTLVEAWAF